MAETVVSSVIDTVGTLLSQKISFLKGVEGQVQNLQDELMRMKHFLKDADRKQDGDELIRNWVYEIRDVSYDAEDAIEVFIAKMEAIKRKPRLERYAHFPVKIFYLNKIGKQIQSVQSRMVGIESSRQRFGIRNLGEGMNDDAQELQHLERRTSEYAEDKNVVATREKSDFLVSLLLKEDSCRCVFSITGMGGVGKTTLAREIYNHSDVRKEFPCRVWVCVSERFNLGAIMKTIIKQVEPGATCESLENDDLKRMVNQCLKGKRYLIVLDDVWEEKGWDILKEVFPDEGKGNRLLLTSRKKSIAQHAGSFRNLYELKTLGEDESWLLFVKTTFSDGRCPSHLEGLGREIVQNCGGLPLAIATIGSLLSQKRTLVSIWEGVLGDINSHSGGVVDEVSTILELSYRDLPPHLKFCFKYLGLFPEDHEISLRRLVHLWVAEGIVVRSGGAGRCVEDIAADYLEQLINRNMVQVATVAVDDRLKSCRLHDLMRDLAIRKGRDESFLEINGSGPRRGDEFEVSVKSSPRYIAIQEKCLHPECLTPRLRTILFFSPNTFSCKLFKLLRELDLEGCVFAGLPFSCKMFKLLRVLDLEGCVFAGLPSEIGEMSLLRYLGLRGTKIKELPESLGRLNRLQTLDVYTRGVEVQIPNVIWKLECLRHLYAWMLMPLKVEGLKGLCTLACIRYHHLMDNNLATLTSLKKLEIRTSDTDILSSSSLSEMVNLHSLTLSSAISILPPLDGISKMSHLSVLKLKGGLYALPPLPPNLSRLVLSMSRLRDDPMPMLAKLERLSVLKLTGVLLDLKSDFVYIRKRMEIPRQGFYQLNFLELILMDLEEIAAEKGALPELRRLRIRGCFRLQTIPEELRSKMV